MFYSCKQLNLDLSSWGIRVSNVENMSAMFSAATEFEGTGLEIWNVSNVVDMRGMFLNCRKLNCDLSGWDVSNVTNMYRMFQGCEKFSCDLSHWDVSNVENMSYMFMECDIFKSDLSSWDVSKVGQLHTNMFKDCSNMKPKLRPSWRSN